MQPSGNLELQPGDNVNKMAYTAKDPRPSEQAQQIKSNHKNNQ